MSILANSETFFSHGHMGVFYEIFLKELNRIDRGKKKKKKKKEEEAGLTQRRNVNSFQIYYYLFIVLVEEE